MILGAGWPQPQQLVHLDRDGDGVAHGLAFRAIQLGDKLGQNILSLMVERQRPGEMVLAYGEAIELRDRDTQHLAKYRQRELPLLAQPDHGEIGLADHGAADGGQRVGQVEHGRLWAERSDVLGDAKDVGDHAHPAHKACRAHGLRGRLVDAIFLADGDIALSRPGLAHRDRVEDEITVREHLAALRGRGDAQVCARLGHHTARDAGCEVERLGVEVHQGDLAARQRGAADQV